MTVEARDQGDVPLRSYCEVSVAVLDKNDHKPSIILTPIEESGKLFIIFGSLKKIKELKVTDKNLNILFKK